MRIPYEKQVILHELGMPIDKHFSVVMYPTAFEWFEDKGIHLNQNWDYSIVGFEIVCYLSWHDTNEFLNEAQTERIRENDRSIRYPAILDKMIEVYKEYFQK